MKRILTAVVALPILFFAIWSTSPYYFAALVAAAVTLALGEFYDLAAKAGDQSCRLLGHAAALGVLACFFAARLDWIAAVLALLICSTLAQSLFSKREMNTALGSVSATVLGVVYVALLAGFLLGVKMIQDRGAHVHLASRLLTAFFIMVMMADTGAYYVGRAIGRRKLAARISPGKTVEGLIGGLVFAAAAGPLCRLAFFNELPLLDSIVLGALIGVVGPVGDLAESLLKRGSGVKDSSALLPGHGGVLDRVDSILFCAPLIYFYARFFL